DDSRGGADAAVSAARRATEVDPNDLLPYLALSQLASAAMQPDVALTAAVDAFIIYQGPSYEALVAATASRATDLAAGRREIERALSAKDTASLRVALGNIALRQGDRETARQSAERALVLDPSNVEAQALIRAAGTDLP